MTIDIETERPIRLADVPEWCAIHLGNRVNRSTVHRWRIRGARGVKLETFLAGGTRFTTVEALHRFFAGSTAAADGTSNAISCERDFDAAEAYLESEGF